MGRHAYDANTEQVLLLYNVTTEMQVKGSIETERVRRRQKSEVDKVERKAIIDLQKYKH